MESQEIKKQFQFYSSDDVNRNIGDFCFVLVREELPHDTDLPTLKRLILLFKLKLKKVSVSPVSWFGLEHTDVKVEYVPLPLGTTRQVKLERKTG